MIPCQQDIAIVVTLKLVYLEFVGSLTVQPRLLEIMFIQYIIILIFHLLYNKNLYLVYVQKQCLLYHRREVVRVGGGCTKQWILRLDSPPLCGQELHLCHKSFIKLGNNIKQ